MSFDDYLWDFACEKYNTDEPTKQQLAAAYDLIAEEAQARAESAYDAWREEGMINDLQS